MCNSYITPSESEMSFLPARYNRKPWKVKGEKPFPFLWQTIVVIILGLLLGSVICLSSADTTWVVRVKPDQKRNPNMIKKVFTEYEVIKTYRTTLILKGKSIRWNEKDMAVDTLQTTMDIDTTMDEIRFSTEKNFLPADFEAMKSFLVDGKITKKRPVAVKEVP